MSESIATSKSAIPKHFRLLKSGEMVKLGDFVANDRQEFEPWEGPNGFMADAFIKPIYRRNKTVRSQAKNWSD